mmetsp:Transcript_18771/g.29831  ORF Transcript_18771/g.29831 Transcript_18771/m.29831 type:complete len:244 (-) Transcript_18771:325-1056(-)
MKCTVQSFFITSVRASLFILLCFFLFSILSLLPLFLFLLVLLYLLLFAVLITVITLPFLFLLGFFFAFVLISAFVFGLRLKLLCYLCHHVDVLTGGLSSAVKFKSLFYLIPKLQTVFVSEILRETVNSRSDRTLVGEVSRYASFVLRLSSANKCRVVNQPIFRSVTFRLHGSEKSFFSSQDLHRRCWILRQVCKASCFRNQASTHLLSNESGEVWGTVAHFFDEVVMKFFSVFRECDHFVCKP